MITRIFCSRKMDTDNKKRLLRLDSSRDIWEACEYAQEAQFDHGRVSTVLPV